MKDLRKPLFAIGAVLLVTGLSMSVAPSARSATLNWVFYDFFNVQPGEYFDNRSARYGEAPIGADCFTQFGIDNGICRRPPGNNNSGTLCSDLEPPDPGPPSSVATYPYTISSYTNENKNRRTVNA